MKRVWISPEARSIVECGGDVKWAEQAESRHLQAKGRVYNGMGRVNGPGPKIDDARLWSFDKRRRVVTIRVDDTRLPEIWMELEVPMAKLLKFIEEEENESADDSEVDHDSEVDLPLEADQESEGKQIDDVARGRMKQWQKWVAKAQEDEEASRNRVTTRSQEKQREGRVTRSQKKQQKQQRAVFFASMQ